jgi:hypothetical protein
MSQRRVFRRRSCNRLPAAPPAPAAAPPASRTGAEATIVLFPGSAKPTEESRELATRGLVAAAKEPASLPPDPGLPTKPEPPDIDVLGEVEMLMDAGAPWEEVDAFWKRCVAEAAEAWRAYDAERDVWLAQTSSPAIADPLLSSSLAGVAGADTLRASITAEVYVTFARGVLPIAARAIGSIRSEAAEQRHILLGELDRMKELECAGRCWPRARSVPRRLKPRRSWRRFGSSSPACGGRSRQPG